MGQDTSEQEAIELAKEYGCKMTASGVICDECLKEEQERTVWDSETAK
jgi:hypothetical protein